MDSFFEVLNEKDKNIYHPNNSPSNPRRNNIPILQSKQTPRIRLRPRAPRLETQQYKNLYLYIRKNNT